MDMEPQTTENANGRIRNSTQAPCHHVLHPLNWTALTLNTSPGIFKDFLNAFDTDTKCLKNRPNIFQLICLPYLFCGTRVMIGRCWNPGFLSYCSQLHTRMEFFNDVFTVIFCNGSDEDLCATPKEILGTRCNSIKGRGGTSTVLHWSFCILEI